MRIPTIPPTVAPTADRPPPSGPRPVRAAPEPEAGRLHRVRRRGLSLAAAGLAALGVLAACAPPAPTEPSGRYRNAVFGTTTKRTESYAQRIDEHGLPETLQLDVYWPDGDPAPANRPVVVFVHGSGFVGGNREDPGMVALAESFARKGYLTASIDYRTREGADSSTWSTAMWNQVIDEAQQDVQAAVRHLKANAQRLGIEPSRVVLAGRSAGAISALNAAFRVQTTGLGSDPYPADVVGVVSIAGFVDTTWIDGQLGDARNTLFFHGNTDTTVPIGWARNSCYAVIAQSGTCDFRTFEGQGHDIVPGNEASIDATMTTDVADWLTL